ncbi:unnamed protein product [Mesocestoides corti]|uniref:Uncharacterized protein n=1 Tax=Mesocestoides corti TaxID=53468 RepID=A0A0R3UMR1_MESCO|nr:unnamed protein product [Mesocestoides corti]
MVEFVQSDIASEPTTLTSCLLEGFRRLIPNTYTSGPRMGSLTGNFKAELRSIPIRTSRLLPVWRLLPSVVVLGVGQHIIRSVVCFGVASYLKRDEESEQLDAEATDSRSRVPDEETCKTLRFPLALMTRLDSAP